MKRLSKTVKKPWGKYYDCAEEKGKWHLKVIFVKKGDRFSLQKHKKRNEFWIIAEGKVKAQKGKKVSTLGAGDTLFIPKNEIHRIKAISDAYIVELTFGQHDENDIIRLADDYGRAS